jgi:hypothetical protein
LQGNITYLYASSSSKSLIFNKLPFKPFSFNSRTQVYIPEAQAPSKADDKRLSISKVHAPSKAYDRQLSISKVHSF